MAGPLSQLSRILGTHGFQWVRAPIKPRARIGSMIGVGGAAHAHVHGFGRRNMVSGWAMGSRRRSVA